MSAIAIAIVVAVLAVAPTLLIVHNLGRFPRLAGRRAGSAGLEDVAAAPASSVEAGPIVSVLVPARNEAANIGAALEAVLACRDIALEVIVLDDRSVDGTADIVLAVAERDARVRLVPGREPPFGVCGKPFACAELARHAAGRVLLFIDADVRLSAAAPAAIAAVLGCTDAVMISGFPRQQTLTLAEKLIVPLMHVVLLGYLPLGFMRRSRHPALGAACGQVCAVEREAYLASGGHAAVLTQVHDGIALARHLRSHGYATDLVDLDALARCRMYTRASEVIEGFAKNAHEGLGSPHGLVPWSVLLTGGHVLPLAFLPAALGGSLPLAPIAAALLASYGGRALLAWRFGHSWLGVLLHPLGVAALVAIQWYALARRLAGRPFAWKGRLLAGRV